MHKSALFLVLAVSLVYLVRADHHGRQKPLRRPVSARQQEAPATPAPTGYPAAGVTPEVPFELPTETQQPDIVYGPPETDAESQPQPDVVYGPPAEEAQQPDSVYGPPESEGSAVEEVEQNSVEEQVKAQDVDAVVEEVLVDEDGSIIAISTTYDQDKTEEAAERLVYQRFPQRRQQPTAVPERLILAKVIKPRHFANTARHNL